jgi:hypothetical protein
MQPVAPPRWDGLSVPRRRPSVATQRAQNTLLLLDLETGRYFTLEGAGDHMWELSDGRRTIEEIVIAVTTVFGADPALVRLDALELFERLSGEGLIDDAR